jgi:hypothetical protein
MGTRCHLASASTWEVQNMGSTLSSRVANGDTKGASDRPDTRANVTDATAVLAVQFPGSELIAGA